MAKYLVGDMVVSVSITPESNLFDDNPNFHVESHKVGEIWTASAKILLEKYEPIDNEAMNFNETLREDQ